MAHRRDIFSFLLFTLVPAGLISACGNEEPELVAEGSGDGDASPGGETASDSSSCQSDKDCRAVDGVCDIGRSVCVDCFTGADCGQSEECVAGACEAFTSCQSSKDCGLDQVCDTGLERCVECVGDNDCADGAVCFATRCSASCSSDKDCAAFDQVCETGAAVCLDCVTSADCSDGMGCSDQGQCAPTPGVGDGDGTGGTAGDGDGPSACAPQVKVLLQRSGAMFENPSEGDNWWDAVSDALDGDESGDILETYSDTVDLSVSTFHMTAGTCPIITDSAESLSPGELSAFLATQKDSHLSADEKIDAPLPEAIAAGAAAVGAGGYLILVVSGNPDSCEEQDGLCAIEPSVEALQAASASGVTTKVLFLESSAAYDGYEQALANAGAGQSVAEMDGLGYACETDPTYYSDVGGSAPFEAPATTAGVSSSLSTLLGSVGGCE